MAEINIEKMAQNVAEKAIQKLKDNGVFIGRWIPVNEGLPEEHKIYLVTYVTKTGRRYVRDCECSYAGQSPRHIEWSKKISGEVIAWMPLPEPYKAESEGAE